MQTVKISENCMDNESKSRNFDTSISKWIIFPSPLWNLTQTKHNLHWDTVNQIVNKFTAFCVLPEESANNLSPELRNNSQQAPYSQWGVVRAPNKAEPGGPSLFRGTRLLNLTRSRALCFKAERGKAQCHGERRPTLHMNALCGTIIIDLGIKSVVK